MYRKGFRPTRSQKEKSERLTNRRDAVQHKHNIIAWVIVDEHGSKLLTSPGMLLKSQQTGQQNQQRALHWSPWTAGLDLVILLPCRAFLAYVVA